LLDRKPWGKGGKKGNSWGKRKGKCRTRELSFVSGRKKGKIIVSFQGCRRERKREKWTAERREKGGKVKKEGESVRF